MPYNTPWWMQQPGMQGSPYPQRPSPQQPTLQQPTPMPYAANPTQPTPQMQPLPNVQPTTPQGAPQSLLDLYAPNDLREQQRRRQQQMMQFGQQGMNMMRGQPIGGGQPGMMPMNLVNPRGGY
jgi:hypothetical protein